MRDLYKLQPPVQRIIKHLSLKYGLPTHVVHEMVLAQFKVARDSIATATMDESDTFKTVRFTGLGVLYPSVLLIDRIKRTKEAYAERNRSEKDDLRRGHTDIEHKEDGNSDG